MDMLPSYAQKVSEPYRGERTSTGVTLPVRPTTTALRHTLGASVGIVSPSVDVTRHD